MNASAYPGALRVDGARPLVPYFQALGDYRYTGPVKQKAGRTVMKQKGLSASARLLLLVLALDTYTASHTTGKGSAASRHALARWCGVSYAHLCEVLDDLGDHTDLLSIRGKTGKRFALTPPPTSPAGALYVSHHATEHLTAISLLPASWLTTRSRLLLYLAALCATTDGTFALSYAQAARLAGTTVKAVKADYKTLKRWDGLRPPLIADTNRTGPDRTALRLLTLPDLPAPGELLDHTEATAVPEAWAEHRVRDEARTILDRWQADLGQPADPHELSTTIGVEIPKMTRPGIGVERGAGVGVERGAGIQKRRGVEIQNHPIYTLYPYREPWQTPLTELSTPHALATAMHALDGLEMSSAQVLGLALGIAANRAALAHLDTGSVTLPSKLVTALILVAAIARDIRQGDSSDFHRAEIQRRLAQLVATKDGGRFFR